MFKYKCCITVQVPNTLSLGRRNIFSTGRKVARLDQKSLLLNCKSDSNFSLDSENHNNLFEKKIMKKL